MDYIVDKYSLENFKISKPKQVKNKYVSKVTIDSEDLIVQFPKMVINDITVDSLTLEFDNKSSSYSQKCYNFLGKLDSLILQHIYSNSPEWFGKQIPMDSIKNMYNSFLKAPKNVDSSVNITLAVTKKSLFFNYKNKSMDFSDINNTYSCAVIAKLKYLLTITAVIDRVCPGRFNNIFPESKSHIHKLFSLELEKIIFFPVGSNVINNTFPKFIEFLLVLYGIDELLINELSNT